MARYAQITVDTQNENNPFSSLSDDERRVANKLLENLSPTQISIHIGLKKNIVKDIIARVHVKLGVSDHESFLKLMNVPPSSPRVPEAASQAEKTPARAFKTSTRTNKTIASDVQVAVQPKQPVDIYDSFDDLGEQGELYQLFIDKVVNGWGMDDINKALISKSLDADPEAIARFVYRQFGVHDMDELANKFPYQNKRPSKLLGIRDVTL